MILVYRDHDSTLSLPIDIRNISVLAYCFPDLGLYLFQLPKGCCCCKLLCDCGTFPLGAGRDWPRADEEAEEDRLKMAGEEVGGEEDDDPKVARNEKDRDGSLRERGGVEPRQK